MLEVPAAGTMNPQQPQIMYTANVNDKQLLGMVCEGVMLKPFRSGLLLHWYSLLVPLFAKIPLAEHHVDYVHELASTFKWYT